MWGRYRLRPKLRLASIWGCDRIAYARAKGAFINRVTTRAKKRDLNSKEMSMSLTKKQTEELLATLKAG